MFNYFSNIPAFVPCCFALQPPASATGKPTSLSRRRMRLRGTSNPLRGLRFKGRARQPTIGLSGLLVLHPLPLLPGNLRLSVSASSRRVKRLCLSVKPRFHCTPAGELSTGFGSSQLQCAVTWQNNALSPNQSTMTLTTVLQKENRRGRMEQANLRVVNLVSCRV